MITWRKIIINNFMVNNIDVHWLPLPSKLSTLSSKFLCTSKLYISLSELPSSWLNWKLQRGFPVLTNQKNEVWAITLTLVLFLYISIYYALTLVFHSHSSSKFWNFKGSAATKVILPSFLQKNVQKCKFWDVWFHLDLSIYPLPLYP